MKHAAATLGSGNLRLAVMLPEGEDLNEWVAVNSELKHPFSVPTIYFVSTRFKLMWLFLFFLAVDFFNQINMLYGTITEFCTEESCPIMSAGPKYEYHWADGHTVKKPIKCSAPKYIDYLMTWVQDQLDDETLFPSKIGVYIIFFTLSLSFSLSLILLILNRKLILDYSFQEFPFPKISYLSQRPSWSGYSEYMLTSIISTLAKSCNSARRRT